MTSGVGPLIAGLSRWVVPRASGYLPQRAGTQILLLLLAICSLTALAVWLGVGALNIGTWHWATPGISDLPTHPVGTWMALAAALIDGVFYPPLFEGGFYGGTRYAPLQIAFLAVTAQIVGDVLIAANVLAVATGALLLITTVALQRQLRVCWPLALAGAALVAASDAGLNMLVFRGDALPAALQVAALLSVIRPTPKRSALAGVACGFALAAKSSALWGIAAVIVWLVSQRSWRSAAIAATAAALCAFALFSLFAWWSEGRMGTNLIALTFDESRRLEALEKLAFIFNRVGWLWLLVPFVFLDFWRLVRGEVSPDDSLFGCQIAFLCALFVLLIVLADTGGWVNHSVDTLVLFTALGMAGIQKQLDAARIYAAILVGVPLFAVALAAWTYIEPLASQARRQMQIGAPSRLPTDYAEFMEEHRQYLSDNPAVPLLAGHRPVVLDAFMLRSMKIPGVDVRQDLARRIYACEFDAVILIGPAYKYQEQWWGWRHFSDEIYEAIIARYDFIRKAPWGALHVRSKGCPNSAKSDLTRPRRSSPRAISK